MGRRPAGARAPSLTLCACTALVTRARGPKYLTLITRSRSPDPLRYGS